MPTPCQNHSSSFHAKLPDAQQRATQLLAMVQVFNEKHASSHLGIPLGAVISPALPQCQPDRAQHEPICCSNCAAFVNMYNEVPLQYNSIHLPKVVLGFPNLYQ
jgi:hypothetical protein